MAEEGCDGQFVGGANGCEMVDVDLKADAKELDAGGSSGSGCVEQGGLVVVEKAFREDVCDVEWVTWLRRGRWRKGNQRVQWSRLAERG